MGCCCNRFALVISQLLAEDIFCACYIVLISSIIMSLCMLSFVFLVKWRTTSVVIYNRKVSF